MNVLVTGGAGFIGSHIVDELVKKNIKTIVIDNSTIKEIQINKKVKYYNADIVKANISRIFDKERPEIVIHQAAQISNLESLNNPLYDAEVNIIGTVNLLECCRQYNIKKIIYASSAAVYGEPEYLPIDEEHNTKPISCYGISKLVPEHYIRVYNQLYGIKYTILRYANVYGPRQDTEGEGGVISIFIDKMLKGERPIIFGTGEQTRDFICVKDIAAANIAALDKGDNCILNISTGVNTSINELVKILNNILGKNLKPVYKPKREGDIEHSYLDNALAVKVLGWKPRVSLEEGLREIVCNRF